MKLKLAIKKTRIYYILRNLTITFRHRKELKEWNKKAFNKGADPHLIKQATILKYKSKYNIDILVETGTFYGDMVYAMKNNFEKIYSVELDQQLYLKAKKRFKKYSHIEIINGDSGVVLNSIVKQLNKPTLFWLDGHYSGGETALGEKVSPIFEELHSIIEFTNYKNVILIDDAREFGGNTGYPTYNELVTFINENYTNYMIEKENDSIRIVPKQ